MVKSILLKILFLHSLIIYNCFAMKSSQSSSDESQKNLKTREKVLQVVLKCLKSTDSKKYSSVKRAYLSMQINEKHAELAKLRMELKSTEENLKDLGAKLEAINSYWTRNTSDRLYLSTQCYFIIPHRKEEITTNILELEGSIHKFKQEMLDLDKE